MNKRIITIIIALAAVAAQAQTNEKRGSINLWGYVVDSFLQTGLEGAKVTLMTADSTVVDSIRTYPYDGNALFHFSLPAKTQNIILRAEQEGYETGYVSMKVRNYKREKEVYAPWINLKKRNSMLEQSLDEVVVTASKVQLVWHGDTLVYNADAFNVPQGSMHWTTGPHGAATITKCSLRTKCSSSCRGATAGSFQPWRRLMAWVAATARSPMK